MSKSFVICFLLLNFSSLFQFHRTFERIETFDRIESFFDIREGGGRGGQIILK
jgi:hypothetical protein